MEFDADRPGGTVLDAFDELLFCRAFEGWVGPVANGSGCVKLCGSVESTTKGALEVVLVDVLLATEAECARRAESSRVSLLTYIAFLISVLTAQTTDTA